MTRGTEARQYKMAKAIIVCGGDFDISLFPEKEAGDIVIGADSGCAYLEKYGIQPDVCIGDWDSLNKVPEKGEVISLQVRKDDTDLVAAGRIAAMRNFKEIVILGALGGRRFSHSIAAIQTVYWLMTLGCKVKILDADCTIYSLGAGDEYFFDESCRGHVSVFSMSQTSVISMKGLWYSGEDVYIESAFPLGVSNAFSGRPSVIKGKEGYAVIVTENDGACFGCCSS